MKTTMIDEAEPKRVGVLLVGVGGSIASTVIAGTALMRKNRMPRVGMLTETGRVEVAGQKVPVREHLGLDGLEQMHYGGWDVVDTSIYDACLRARVLQRESIELVREDLESIRSMPGIDARHFVRKINCQHCIDGASSFDIVEQLREQIRKFSKHARTDRLVIVNVASTECVPPDANAKTLLDPDDFVKGLKQSSPDISPAMLYFCAAILEGVPHVNFTPNVAEVPALRTLALERRVSFCGRDGKTGQTFLKTVMAPAFRARQLRIDGWFSTNILGNGDGHVLSDPASLQAKLETKTSVLDDMLEYRVGDGYDAPSHVVSIHYYPPRGDAKEAWDNIDLVGFLGMPMQLKVNFLCRDSILAAPLVIDLVRLVRHASDRGLFGNFTPASAFFKNPLRDHGARAVHDFSMQQVMLGRYVLGANGTGNDSPFFW